MGPCALDQGLVPQLRKEEHEWIWTVLSDTERLPSTPRGSGNLPGRWPMTKFVLLTTAALLTASAAFAQSAGTSGNVPTGSSTGNVMTRDTPNKDAAAAGSNAEQQERGNAAQTQSNAGGGGGGQ